MGASLMRCHAILALHARSSLTPILMTWPGVMPLMFAKGASDSTQHATGTGVFGGMISGTLLAVFFVPCFYVVLTRAVEYRQRKRD